MEELLTPEQELEQWFKDFDDRKDKFKWFIVEYFTINTWNNLLALREQKNQEAMLNVMNEIWFELPDSRFNIMNNPAGWREFLYMIEL